MDYHRSGTGILHPAGRKMMSRRDVHGMTGFEPGAILLAVPVNDPPCTIFPAGITWVFCHNFGFSRT
jgi:hypothetical protein